MNAVDIAVLVVVCAAFFAVTCWLVYKKIKSKGGADCDSSCPSCNSCPHCNEKKE